MATVDEGVELVRKARQLAQFLGNELATQQRAFEEQHAVLIGALEEARRAQYEAESALRNSAVQAYLNNPQQGKQLGSGVSIREKIDLEYDRNEAYEWAFIQGNALAITPASLNVEVFEQLARKFPRQVPFVRQCRTFTAIIARQL